VTVGVLLAVGVIVGVRDGEHVGVADVGLFDSDRDGVKDWEAEGVVVGDAGAQVL
jgi:hypothetical protein